VHRVRRQTVMGQARVVFGLVLVLVLPTSLAQAWNGHSHMLTAAIAYQELQPDARGEVVRLLRQHPRWIQRAQALAGLEEVAIFMDAARWADYVRMDPVWDRPEWHYINIPILRDGVAGQLPTVPNVLTALQQAAETLRKSTAMDADRAIALCWLFHLVGDVHQPLHTVSLFSPLYPEGDRGGTRFYVRLAPGLATMNLHYLWDNVLGQEDGVQSVWNKAARLMARSDLARSTFPELTATDFTVWIDESVHHARLSAYPQGGEGSRDRTDGAVVPADYGKQAQALGERRVVLAGYRLADLLSALLKPAP
jgi:hypothetical protein